MRPILTVLLVGSHFHPPAKALLEVLPEGFPFGLQPDPFNKYDPQAIKVMIEPEDLAEAIEDLPTPAREVLETNLNGFGLSIDQILQWPEPFHCGHVGASEGKPAKAEKADGTNEVWSELGSPDGALKPYQAKLTIFPGASAYPWRINISAEG
jgi:hypothetical protein